MPKTPLRNGGIIYCASIWIAEPLSSRSLPTFYSLINLPFDAINSGKMKRCYRIWKDIKVSHSHTCLVIYCVTKFSSLFRRYVSNVAKGTCIIFNIAQGLRLLTSSNIRPYVDKVKWAHFPHWAVMPHRKFLRNISTRKERFYPARSFSCKSGNLQAITTAKEVAWCVSACIAGSCSLVIFYVFMHAVI